jgi:GNAT superfamily N-acetyltransferase
LIREATAGDVDDLALLRWQSHSERDELDEGDFEAYRVGFARWWSTQQGRCRAVVATDDERIVAMGFLALVNRVPVPGALDRHHADIQSMYVLPAYRGAGVGSQIVGALVGLACESGCTRVEVHSGRRAVPFYEHAGFEHFPQLLNLDLKR